MLATDCANQLSALWNSPEPGCGAILTGTISMKGGTSTRRNGCHKKEEGGVVGDLRGPMIFRGRTQKSDNGFVKQDRKLAHNC